MTATGVENVVITCDVCGVAGIAFIRQLDIDVARASAREVGWSWSDTKGDICRRCQEDDEGRSTEAEAQTHNTGTSVGGEEAHHQ